MAAKRKDPADASEQVARERLSVLELAERLGNAAEACRRSGVDRTSFYQWRRRYAREGLAGLKNRPPIHRSHPHTTPADVSRRIATLAMANPAHGCDRIAIALARHGVDLSAVTIQKILHKAGLGTHLTRAAKLEGKHARGDKLTAVQAAFVEGMNPCFREREAGTRRPGELLAAGTFFLGRFGSGTTYVHAVIDCFSSYVFAVLAANTRAEATVDVLRSEALPFFRRKSIVVTALSSGYMGEGSGQALRQYLSGEGLEHRERAAGDSNGFLDRFRRVTLAEFLPSAPTARASLGMAPVRRAFAGWLVAYNATRPHDGFRNYGIPPAAVIR